MCLSSPTALRRRGGIPGPSRDVYLFSHFQVDAQGSCYLGKGLTAIVAGLNLNNAVFGFYQGSPQFLIQHEYYKPTYTFGRNSSGGTYRGSSEAAC